MPDSARVCRRRTRQQARRELLRTTVPTMGANTNVAVSQMKGCCCSIECDTYVTYGRRGHDFHQHITAGYQFRVVRNCAKLEIRNIAIPLRRERAGEHQKRYY
jgi:hypothetical protein